jgi:hypothetical protein
MTASASRALLLALLVTHHARSPHSTRVHHCSLAIRSPCPGKLLEVNQRLVAQPELLVTRWDVPVCSAPHACKHTVHRTLANCQVHVTRCYGALTETRWQVSHALQAPRTALQAMQGGLSGCDFPHAAAAGQASANTAVQ